MFHKVKYCANILTLHVWLTDASYAPKKLKPGQGRA